MRHKDFDAVQMMRSVRDRISAQIENMTAEPEIAWLASVPLNDPFLEKLRQKATRPEDAARWR